MWNCYFAASFGGTNSYLGRNTLYKIGCDRLVFKVTLHQEQCTIWL